MKGITCVVVAVLMSACATNLAVTKGEAAGYERTIRQLEEKNALLAQKVVRLTVEQARSGQASVASLADYSDPSLAVRASALERIATRLVARVNPPEGECDTKPGALVVKNETGRHMILLVDGAPTAIVSGTNVTDYVGPGVTVHLCMDMATEDHELSGGVFADLRPGTRAEKVFYLKQMVKKDQVNVVAIEATALRGS